VGLADLTDQAVNEPEIRKWMEKIKIYHNSEMEQYSNQYPEETAPHAERMIIKLKNGEIIEEEDIFIRGMTKRPLFFDDVVFKYDDCGVTAGISKKKIDAIISMVNHIEQIEDVGTLMAEIKN
jgi:2-methylcitrate dehydratase PrpD